jgi:endonuclease G, mitochondrial
VIGNPPNVAVPTHFAKVVLTSRPASPNTPHIPEISTGAFVLPNASIPDDTPLQSFVVPVEAVEKAAGLQLFADDVKKASRHVCQSATCQLEVRRFDDAQKQVGKDKKAKAIAAPKS